MVRIINWIVQNAVSVCDIIDLIVQAIRVFIMILVRMAAFTTTTSDDNWVAKLNDNLKVLDMPVKAIKDFLLQTGGSSK